MLDCESELRWDSGVSVLKTLAAGGLRFDSGSNSAGGPHDNSEPILIDGNQLTVRGIMVSMIDSTVRGDNPNTIHDANTMFIEHLKFIVLDFQRDGIVSPAISGCKFEELSGAVLLSTWYTGLEVWSAYDFVDFVCAASMASLTSQTPHLCIKVF